MKPKLLEPGQTRPKAADEKDNRRGEERRGEERRGLKQKRIAVEAEAGSHGGRVVKHIVLAQFKEEVTPELLDQLIRGYAALVDIIPSMKDFHWGTNVIIENMHQGFTHVFESTFESVEGVKEYNEYSAHAEFANEFLPATEQVQSAMDIYLQEKMGLSDSSADEDEVLERMTMSMMERRGRPAKRGGSIMGRHIVSRDRNLGDEQLYADYFCPNPIYGKLLRHLFDIKMIPRCHNLLMIASLVSASGCAVHCSTA
ncbi:Stress-response A/B barrel domain-containing protein HS1 [Dichanthelium oligosanthes]|uniref:Stress-response A/B barrel domain-containing protein HS1 n=1 Tax=Dichanthelium oligosanthes TaxID=888268 RepID=A0A1E5WCN9_9POAL|nr:Stress-response A/B barrel domain-containing protein HS1 [Dichanthelium oligosanthes]